VSEGGGQLVWRSHAALSALALALLSAGSAAAATVSFDGRVLRWHDAPGERADVPAVGFNDRDFTLLLSQAENHLQGCVQTLIDDEPPALWRVSCALGSLPRRELRYRFSLGDLNDELDLHFSEYLDNQIPAPGGGIVYAGSGDDIVLAGDRVYGGPGNDSLQTGRHAFGDAGNDDVGGRFSHGGPGDDNLFPFGASTLADGGPGDDRLRGGDRAYGGPGDDVYRADNQRSQMFVGGPGRDLVHLWPDDRGSDIIHLRGGGRDVVECGHSLPDLDYAYGPRDVLLVDRVDRVGPRCAATNIMYSGRPGSLRARQDHRIAPPQPRSYPR
jgi:hypothetical protein